MACHMLGAMCCIKQSCHIVFCDLKEKIHRKVNPNKHIYSFLCRRWISTAVTTCHVCSGYNELYKHILFHSLLCTVLTAECCLCKELSLAFEEKKTVEISPSISSRKYIATCPRSSALLPILSSRFRLSIHKNLNEITPASWPCLISHWQLTVKQSGINRVTYPHRYSVTNLYVNMHSLCPYSDEFNIIIRE